MQTLQQSGMRIELEWTPGHAEVQGNKIADRLAKEAAKEAQEQDITVHTMVTKQDIITASRNSISEKWQHQWENSFGNEKKLSPLPLVPLLLHPNAAHDTIGNF
jgi:polyphosphate kinase